MRRWLVEVGFALAVAVGGGVAALSISGEAKEPPEPGPLCAGRELGITREQVAAELAANFCACSEPPAEGCVADMAEQLCPAACETVLCGEQLVTRGWCLAVTADCAGIPVACWELAGWDL